MKLPEIQELWSKDVIIDRTELSHASLNVPKLHHKYYKIYSSERLILRKLQEDLKTLKQEKYDFYLDGPTEEQHAKGWHLPAKGRILKSDVLRYVESDKDVITAVLKVALYEEKINFLGSILTTIGNMSFHISNAIKWTMFQNGLNG